MASFHDGGSKDKSLWERRYVAWWEAVCGSAQF